MDEYSKTGSRSYRAESRKREADRDRKMSRVLAEPTEADFVQALHDVLGIKPTHPSFHAILRIWREQHL